MSELIKTYFLMLLNSRFVGDRKAASSVEFAILLSVILMVLGGLAEFGYQGIVRSNLDRMSNELSAAISIDEEIITKKEMIKYIQAANKLAQDIGFESVKVSINQYRYNGVRVVRTSGNKQDEITLNVKNQEAKRGLIKDGQVFVIVNLEVKHAPFAMSDVLGSYITLSGSSVAYSISQKSSS